MFERFKKHVTTASKETIKEEIKKNAPTILAGASFVLLAYLCIKVNGKPVTITVNVNGGYV